MTGRGATIVRGMSQHRGDLAWGVLVMLVYGALTVAVSDTASPRLGGAMTLAIHLTEGRSTSVERSAPTTP